MGPYSDCVEGERHSQSPGGQPPLLTLIEVEDGLEEGGQGEDQGDYLEGEGGQGEGREREVRERAGRGFGKEGRRP